MRGRRRVLTHWRGLRWVAGVAAAVVTLAWAVPAAAATIPYASTSSGYDVGFPNCGKLTPAGSTFAVVGLGDGRPFTTNGCLGAEWKAATELAGSPGPALYFNTGYSGAYGRDITASCANYAGPSFTGVPRHDQRAYAKAWEVGCSEAAYAASVAKAVEARTGTNAPSMWWADIETGNSWSTNQTVNRYTVDGISYEILTVLKSVAGVYSYPGAWNQLVGTTFTPAFDGAWGPSLLGVTCHSGFDGLPVWVVQGSASGGVDTDTGCG